MRQGSVTLNINDYDNLLIDSRNIKPDIKILGDTITVEFPRLSVSMISHIQEKYPDFKIEYWHNELKLQFKKPASNEQTSLA